MDKYVFLYWTGKEFKLINILRNIIYHHSNHGDNYKVIFLSPENINQYIDDIPTGFDKLIPAHQADIARVFAVEKYGGIWLDSDTIVMNNLKELFDIIDSKNGFFIKENNTVICNGVFGSRKNTLLMKQWKEIIIEKMKDINSIEWTTLGSYILKKDITDKNLFNDYTIFNGLDNMYPINWENIPQVFIEEHIDSYTKVERKFQPLIILVNSAYKMVENLSIEQIVSMQNPLGYFLRKSLPSVNMFISEAINFGDAISHIFYTKLSLRNVNKVSTNHCNDFYLSTGSHLLLCNKNSVILGAGFISENDDLGRGDWNEYTNKIYNIPKKIISVRGPLTRQKLLNMGVECPDKYGDPLIVFPLVYNPSIKRTSKIGIIPHYIDKDSSKFLYLKNMLGSKYGIKVIDILTGVNYTEFIDNICSCEYIISSSLHGVIMGVAYNRKTIFTEFSNNVIGDKFKFKDFFASIKTEYNSPDYNDPDILKYIINVKNNDMINIGNSIINECPFITPERKMFLVKEWTKIRSEDS